MFFVAAVQFYHVDYFERETNIFVTTDKESFLFRLKTCLINYQLRITKVSPSGSSTREG